MAVQLEMEEVIDMSLEWYRTASDKTKLDPLLRESIYCAVARNGRKSDWDSLSNMASTALGRPRMQAMAAIGSTKNMELLRDILNKTFTHNYADFEVDLVILGCAKYADNILTVWYWVKENWDKLVIKFPLRAGGSPLGWILGIVLPLLLSPMLLKDMEDFFSKVDTFGIDKIVAKSLDIVRAGVRTTANDREDAMEWLENVTL